ncbi:beta strand repeat-containing protein [Haloferula rosea]|uniref:Autotransporter-associated beta strand repeat-containing protein n=1 Tax=Haloferula rosea TaxID=490093 RepID=A0A934VC50_9BACT|nr:autotransporter-associated beta strand repeat-containing protein [Haloferula rosea]MBK1828078.1 autotransporter-associated beta strand repeat-containing protein [Haloferula rosea]
MKYPKFTVAGGASLAAPLFLAVSSNLHAQLTWDPALDGGVTPGAGAWDTTTANWWDGAANQTWDNTGATEAIFGDAGANYDVTIATGGVTVGDLSFSGASRLLFRAETDNDGVMTIKPGGAVWDTGGAHILILQNLTNDVGVSIGSGDTLTVNGGGIFNAGEKPNGGAGATWVAAGATLDVTAATDVRGNAGSIGQFDTVELAGGSTFRAERNGNETYGNDWVLEGDVTFTTRFARQENLSGVISGAGRVTIDSTVFQENQVDQTYIFSGDANTYTGGTTVDGTSHVAVLGINNDNKLGAVPGAADADNIVLKGGAYLRMNGAVTIDANRGITLDGGGGFIASGAASSVAGLITGNGGLAIGRTADGSGNVVTLSNSGNDYGGGTNVLRGTVRLGADNAFGSDGPLTVGGLGGVNATVDLEGFDAVVGGVQLGVGNTRQIRNNGATASTLTIDVADTESYNYGGNLTGSSVVNLIKDGPGTQIFDRTSGYTSDFGDLTVNEGALELNNGGTTDVTGDISVTGGTLRVDETLVGVTSVSVTGGALRISSDDCLGSVPGASTPDFLTLDGGTLNVRLSSDTGGSFAIDSNRGMTLGAGGGVIQTTTPSGAWAVTYNGDITGVGSLTKDAAQTLVLGGANSYTGATTVSAGRLILTGSLTSDVTVESGASFVGGDQVTGTGTGTLPSLTLEDGSLLACFINTGAEDATKSVVSGAVTIGSTATLAVIDQGGDVALAGGTKLTLIDYTGGSLSGTFDGLPDGSMLTVGSNTFILDYDDDVNPGTVTLTVQAGSAYDAWVAANYPGVVGGFDDDDDLDGLSNGEEWYFGGTDPLTGGEGSPLVDVVATGAGTFTFTHLRPTDAAGATASYEWSSTLTGAWNPSGGSADGITVTLTDGAATPDVPGYEEVTVTVAVTAGSSDKVFARVNLTMP